MHNANSLALLLIPISYWNIFVSISNWSKRRDDFSGIFSAAILSGLVIIVWAWASAIMLSLVGRLDWNAELAWWISGCGISFILAKGKGIYTARMSCEDVKYAFMNLKSRDKIAVAVTVAILMAALTMGVCSPPNNNDSLIYHLPRQILWMSSKTVFISEAPNEVMLKWPPLSEYIGVNLWLLGDTDRFHNIVQLFALCGCIILLWMIVKLLGGSKSSVLFSSLFAVTVPAVFYQASNTKNDIVVSFFLLCIIWVSESCVVRRRISLTSAIVIGFCIAASLMTKGTAIIFLAILLPFELWRLVQAKTIQLVRTAIIVLAITTVLISPHYLIQEKRIADADIGGKREHVNDKITVGNTISVLSRNIALQMALPWENWNREMEAIVLLLHKAIGAKMDSPATTFHNIPFAVTYWPNSEDNVTCIIHFLCMLLFPLISVYYFSVLQKSGGLGYCFLPILMLVVFSAIFKWQPWHTRLLIPVFIIGAIPFGLLLSLIDHAILDALLIGSFIIWLFPCFSGWHRPLLGSQPVYQMDDLSQRVIKAPSSALDSIAISELLSHLFPRSIQLNDSFYTTLVYMGRFNREWPIIKSVNDKAKDTDVILRSLKDGEIPPPPEAGMCRAYLSSHVLMDLSDKLYNESRFYPSPTFTGLINLKGMDEPVGPFPKYKQPLFCNAHYPSMSFQLNPDKAKRDLKVEMLLPYWSNLASNSFMVSVDGHQLSSVEMTQRGKLYSTRISILPSMSPVKITIQFTRGDQNTSACTAASVTAIQLLPPIN